MPLVTTIAQPPKPTIDVDIPMYTEAQITRTREIGKGSFGKVWCGVVNGETVAIKDMVCEGFFFVCVCFCLFVSAIVVFYVL
jgi:hypothetical protein